jgi:tetratricopeptide (TPR) repeat protein
MIFWFMLLFLLQWGPTSLYADLDAKEYMQSGVQHMQDKEYEKAVYAFQKAIELSPDMPEIHNILGVTYLSMPDSTDKAQLELEKAIQLKPDYAEAYFNLGILYANSREDPLTAKEYFEKTLQYDPRVAGAYHALGLIALMQENNQEKAVELFQKSISLDPNLAQAYFGLGLTYTMMGKPQEVLGPITKLRELRQEQFAASLESMIRGDGVFLGGLDPGSNTNAEQPAPQETAAPSSDQNKRKPF